MKTALSIVAVILVLVGGYLWISNGTETPGPTPTPELATKTYSNAQYGISFTYPDSYVLQEREMGTRTRLHHNITLMDKEAAANIPQNGEGPPSITVDIIQNNLDDLSITQWVNDDNRSNFKLSPDAKLASTTVAGKEAVQYTWDGLYRGQSMVFEHKDNVVMLSVTSLTPGDAILRDFTAIVSTFVVN